MATSFLFREIDWMWIVYNTIQSEAVPRTNIVPSHWFHIFCFLDWLYSDWDLRLKLCIQISDGMGFLHRNGLLHSKFENLITNKSKGKYIYSCYSLLWSPSFLRLQYRGSPLRERISKYFPFNHLCAYSFTVFDIYECVLFICFSRIQY